jgi:hypothetical protein
MENPVPQIVKTVLDWRFLFKLLVAFLVIMLLADLVSAFVWPQFKTVLFSPFSWARARFFPPKAPAS